MLQDAGHGLARVTLPEGWVPKPFLPYRLSLQATDPRRGRFCLVISEPRRDFDETMDLAHHAARTLEYVTRSTAVVGLRGPAVCKVGGFEALQYELDASDDRDALVYLHTTIAGRHAFHQVLCWSVRGAYDRAAFDELVNGFEELAEAQPAARPSQVVYAAAASHYDVH